MCSRDEVYVSILVATFWTSSSWPKFFIRTPSIVTKHCNNLSEKVDK